MDPYFLDVLTGVGINIILAVSLNLVNGYTGQFSLGHAGFMSVGAYMAAAVSVFLGPRLLGESGGTALQQGTRTTVHREVRPRDAWTSPP